MLSTVVESQFFVIWDTTKTKRYQQEIRTYFQFSERCKIFIFLHFHILCIIYILTNKNELKFTLDDSKYEGD